MKSFVAFIFLALACLAVSEAVPKEQCGVSFEREKQKKENKKERKKKRLHAVYFDQHLGAVTAVHSTLGQNWPFHMEKMMEKLAFLSLFPKAGCHKNAGLAPDKTSLTREIPV